MILQELHNAIDSLAGNLGQDEQTLRGRVRETIDACGESLLLVKGDLSGIQTYLSKVNQAEDVDGGVAKRLRGRSFYLSAICYAIADELTREVNLDPYQYILHAGGGKFLVALPYSWENENKLNSWKKEIDKWLWQETWGEIYLNLGVHRCDPGSLKTGFSEKVALPLQAQLDEGKMNKFASILRDGICLPTHGGTFQFPVFQASYFEECHSCGCLPAGKRVQEDKSNLCRQCNEFEEVGSYAELPTHNFLDFDPKATGMPIVEFHRNRAILRPAQNQKRCLPRVSSFIPDWHHYHKIDRTQCTGNDEEDKRRLLCGHCSLSESEQKPEECRRQRLATRFHCLATLSGLEHGAQKIAVLSGDGDDFGYHLNSTEGIGLEDHVVLGKLIHIFFSDHLIESLKNYDCILIYSGGDDLVVVGPWANVIMLGKELQREFHEYTCGHLHFSAGILITNPQDPIYQSIQIAHKYLEEAKKAVHRNCDPKNAVQVMSTRIYWQNFDAIFSLANALSEAERAGLVTRGFIYGLYRICDEYERFAKGRRVEGLRYLGWLASHLTRNIKLKWDDDPEKEWKESRAEALLYNLSRLLDITDETYLPYLRFALDWATLNGRKEKTKGGRQ